MDTDANNGVNSSMFGFELLTDNSEFIKVSKELTQKKLELVEIQNKVFQLEAALEKEKNENNARMQAQNSEAQQLEAQKTIEELQNYIQQSEQERQYEKQDANTKISEYLAQIQQSNQERENALLQRDTALKQKEELEHNQEQLNNNLKQANITIEQKQQTINSLQEKNQENQTLFEKLQESQKTLLNQEQSQNEQNDEKYQVLLAEKKRVAVINEELWQEMKGYKDEIDENKVQLNEYQNKNQKLQEVIKELTLKLEDQEQKYDCIPNVEDMKQIMQQQFEEEKKEIQIQNERLKQQCQELSMKLEEITQESEERRKKLEDFQNEKSTLLEGIEFERNKVKSFEAEIYEIAEAKNHLQEELYKNQEEINELKTYNLSLEKEREVSQAQLHQALQQQEIKKVDFKTLLSDTILPQIEKNIIEGPDKNYQRKILTQKALLPILNQLKDVCYKRQILLAFTMKQ